MLKKIVNYSIVGVLLLVLVGGSIYVLARPTGAQAEQGWARETTTQGSQNYGQGRGASQEQEIALGQGLQGQGARGQGTQGQSLQGQGVQGQGAQGQGQGNARVESLESGNRGGQGSGYQGQGAADNAGDYLSPDEWETVQGTVIVADNELTIQTAEGELVVGMGQSWYREQAGFTVNVGDEVIVNGYEEDGEFKAGTVENLTSGATVALREQGGRPMWAGRGNLRNQP